MTNKFLQDVCANSWFEKQYFENAVWAGVADKTTVMSAVYKNKETQHVFAKRFIVDKFILDKVYNYLDEKSEMLFFSADPEPTVWLHFSAPAGKKAKKQLVVFKDLPVKGAQVRGVRLASQKVKKIDST